VSLKGFPRRTLRGDRTIYRIHKSARAPWWFSCTGNGRFDPVGTGMGACYLAQDPLGAWVEVFRKRQLLPEVEIAERSLLAVALKRDLRLADITVVILVPGMGDDVQTIKAGIMEIADIFVINKSDREGAERVEREIRALQSLALRHDGWTPPIVKTVASEGTGVNDLAAAIAGYVAYLQKEDLALKKSVQNWQERLVEMLRDVMLEKARAQFGDGNLAKLAAEVAEHKRDPYTLVEEIAAKENT